jgi:NAD-dependent SIR2 family protein deacetylase
MLHGTHPAWLTACFLVGALVPIADPTLPDPQAMFSMDYFTKDPKPFFDFAQEIYPGNFKPAPSHYFIQQIESHGKLMRNCKTPRRNAHSR